MIIQKATGMTAYDFGNKIITDFLNSEKEIHYDNEKTRYSESTDTIQFVKTKKYKLMQNGIIDVIKYDKQLFERELFPIIILIGEKENEVSTEIKDNYGDDAIFIDIYIKDVNDFNYKLITSDTSKIIDFLRVISYIISKNDLFFQNNGITDITYFFDGYKDINNNIDIYKIKCNIENVKEKINEIPNKYKNKSVVAQLVVNNKIDISTCCMIGNILFDKLNVERNYYITAHISNADDIEIILWFI